MPYRQRRRGVIIGMSGGGIARIGGQGMGVAVYWERLGSRLIPGFEIAGYSGPDGGLGIRWSRVESSGEVCLLAMKIEAIVLGGVKKPLVRLSKSIIVIIITTNVGSLSVSVSSSDVCMPA